MTPNPQGAVRDRHVTVRDVAGGVAVALVHAGLCALVLVVGFDHISDDDFARVTIAQAFAHSPRLDPSGTSWLPFPFWTLGSVMTVIGRSLAAARMASIGFSSCGFGVFYLALRIARIRRSRAMAGVALAALSPWTLWLGAATVPESLTATLSAAAAIALGSASTGTPKTRGSQIPFAVGMLAACLSRYEAWPVAAMLALVVGWRTFRVRLVRNPNEVCAPTRFVALVTVAILSAGPLVWMTWNCRVHGDALHFFERVSRFKRALGEGSSDTVEALLFYPRLLVTMRPELVVGFLCAFTALRGFKVSIDECAHRWRIPLLCAVAQVGFLAYGNAHDGAPTHHGERALLGVVLLFAACTADVVAEAAPVLWRWSRPTAAAGGFVLVALWLGATVATLRAMPGTGTADRRAQVAAGDTLRREGASRLQLTPCAYEHFALIAAYEAPENVTVYTPSGGPRVTSTCPAVERR